MINRYYDVIVVGGGPSGSMAAIEVAKAGFSVCILEKDRDIGTPVRCGEAIGYTGLNQFFKRGTHEEVVETIRKDEANFLDGEQTIMYRID